MEHEFSFWSLLLITGLAAFVPLLSRRLRPLGIPIVVLEILAGIVVGKSGFDLIESSPALDFLALFGFTYLMFLSGLEVDFSSIASLKDRNGGQRAVNPLVLGGATFVLTLSASFLISLGMSEVGLVQSPLFMALILSTTSLGIVSPVLRERQLTVTVYGQSVLISALVADFATLLLISVVVAVTHSGGLTFDLLLVLLLLGAFFTMARVGQAAMGLPQLRRVVEELSQATAQIEVRGAFALMVAFIVLAQTLGAEIILGAFLAGGIIALLSEHGGESHLHLKLDAIGFGFFIPIFFIMVGVRFDLPALVESPGAFLIVPLLLGAAYAVKFLPALLFRRGFSWREALAAGALLSSRLSLIIAASAIALELGAIDGATNAGIVLVAIVTCTLSPILFNRILPPQAALARRGIILVGLGQLSAMLAERLRQSGEDVTVVDTNPARIKEMRDRGLVAIEGSAADPAILEQAGAGSAETLIAATSKDDLNKTVCRLARDRFQISQRVALIRDPGIASEMIEAGTRVVQPQMATALALEGAIHFPAAFDMLTDKMDGVEMRDVLLSNARMAGKPMRRIRLPGNVLVVGIRRDGDLLVPHGSTALRQGDLLMLVGSPDDLHLAMASLNPRGD